MDTKEYMTKALRTDLKDYTPVVERFRDVWGIDPLARITHAVLGVTSEAGELADAVKRHLMYGAPIDRRNIKEEIGDVLWYLSLLCDACDITLEQAMEANIAKLQARYPEKFSEEKALNRDLNAERDALK